MSTSEIFAAAMALPLNERIELAQELWESITDDGDDPELTPAQLAELDRRAEEALKNPGAGVTVEQAFARIEEALRAGR